MKIAIVGAGAAGLMAAITAARNGVRADLFEQSPEVGRKILASGNGRCNITNTSLGCEDYFGRHPSFVDYALKTFDFRAFSRFCESIGLLLRTLDDGRAYPLSDEARSVHGAMKRQALHLGVRLRTEEKVGSIESTGGRFHLSTDKAGYDYDRVLVSTGLAAAPQLGGGMDGVAFARQLGHSIVDPWPALVGLHLKEPWPSKMSGVRIDGEVTTYVDGKRSETYGGDILFTKYGVSGFSILDASIETSRAMANGRNVVLGIDLLPQFSRQSLVGSIEKVAKRNGFATSVEILQGLLPYKSAKALLQALEIPLERNGADLTPKNVRAIASRISDWRFSVSDTHGYRHAEVAGGGVLCSEVDAKTMESKIVPGLYFSGELLDVVGKRGGYNLHFAWASGYLAGKAMARR
ncbi:NAD(P)/FAD-dependent oxidoreductase [Hydrogenimonas sp.]